MGKKTKKSSPYVLQPWLLQDITWIYYISLLVKHIITYCWKTEAYWYQVNIIITKAKQIYVTIVCTAAPVKRYRKTIWKDASNTGHNESSSQKVTTREGVTKSNLQKQNTNYVYLLSSKQNSKALYVNKTCVSHRHQSHLTPNTSITYHLGAGSTWNALLRIGETLEQTGIKSI